MTQSQFVVFDRIARSGACYVNDDMGARLARTVAVMLRDGLVSVDWRAYRVGVVTMTSKGQLTWYKQEIFA